MDKFEANIDGLTKYYLRRYPLQLEQFLGGERELNTHVFDERLQKIPNGDVHLFLYFLSLEVLLDEVFFTYFKDEYYQFEKIKKYPKLTFCGHGSITSNPWSVFNYLPGKYNIRKYSKNKLDPKDPNSLLFKNIVKVFLVENKYAFSLAGLDRVKTVILNDKDIAGSDPYSQIFFGLVQGSLN